MLKSRPSSPNTPPDCAVRAWVTCDGIIQADGANAGQECLSVAPPAFGPTTAAAEAAAAEEALAAMWTHPPGSDLWLCHQCTVEHAALPASAWKLYNADEERAVAALLGVDLDAAVAAAERTVE